MAIYHLTTKVVQRSKGHSAVAAAAYRARTEIVNQRTGETWDYSKNNADVLFERVYAPQKAPAWMNDRAQVWNALEKADRQWNGQVARDFTIALPHELTLEQQRYAVQDWVKENFTRKGFIADVAIHKPSSYGDTRNTHAHVMVSMRTVDGDGFATAKYRATDRKADLDAWRESWERIGNEKLQRFGHAPTLDRRTLVEQGSDLTPTIHLGKDAASMERDGKMTDRGDMLRAIQRENAARKMQRRIDQTANANNAARDRANDDAPVILKVQPPRIVQPPQIVQPEPPVTAQSAVDRLKGEERAAQIEALRSIGRNRWAAMGQQMREIMGALRSLKATMGVAILDIVKGGNFFQARDAAKHETLMREKEKNPVAGTTGSRGGPVSQPPPQEPDNAAKMKVERVKEPERNWLPPVRVQSPQLKAEQSGAMKTLDRMAEERKKKQEQESRQQTDRLRQELERKRKGHDRKPEL